MGLLSRATQSTALHFTSGKESERVKSKIAQYHETYINFNCILFEAPDSRKDNIHRKLAEMIKYPGIVIPLSTSRPLILFPPGVDHELVAHRISKSLNMTPLLSFEATSPGEALTRIDSLP